MEVSTFAPKCFYTVSVAFTLSKEMAESDLLSQICSVEMQLMWPFLLLALLKSQQNG